MHSSGYNVENLPNVFFFFIWELSPAENGWLDHRRRGDARTTNSKKNSIFVYIFNIIRFLKLGFYTENPVYPDYRHNNLKLRAKTVLAE